MKTDLGYIRGAQGEVGPQGETGAQGPAATIEVGSVTTSAYGTPANVVNSGTENAARFDFTIPQGPPGETVADVSELTANFITESTESYPTYTTTEKMKVILGKIKKYLADLKSKAESIASKITEAEKNITNIQTDVGGITTALTGKLDKTDVIANLTATTSGKALDATQGKALQDQITQLNSDLWISYSNRNAVLIDNATNITNKSVPINKNGAIQLHTRSNDVSGRCFERLSINGTVVYESQSITGRYVYLWSPIFYVKKEDRVVVALEAPDKGERYVYFYG